MTSSNKETERTSCDAPKITAAGVTDVGCVRVENQDRFFISQDKRIVVVADGMGGHQGGSRAASILVQVFEDDANSSLPGFKSRKSIRSWADRVFKAASSEIFLTSQSDHRVSGMGTTGVALIIGDSFVHVAHAGDSRAYRFRDNKLVQITRDHSVIQELVEQGIVPEEQRRGHPRSHIVTRHIGEQEVDVEHHAKKHRSGDLYLLCSDGLTDVLEDADIEDVLVSVSDMRLALDRLVTIAKEKGGPDNITITAARLG